MTAPTPPVAVTPTPGSRLDALIEQFADLKPRVDELTTRLKALSDAIKLELTNAAPEASVIDVWHQALPGPYRLSYVERWDLDTKRLKAEDVETYVRYARKGGSWQLRAVKG